MACSTNASRARRAVGRSLACLLVLGCLLVAPGCRKDAPADGNNAGPAANGTADGANNDSGTNPAPFDPGEWANVASARPVLVRPTDAFDVKGLFKIVESGADGAVLEAGQRAAGCPDKCMTKDDRAEHSARLNVEIPESGTYYPWVRVWWLDGCGNSIGIGLERDGQPVFEVGHDREGKPVLVCRTVEDSTYKTWHWLELNRPEGVRLEKGTYTIVVRNTEDGAWVSALVFSRLGYDQYIPRTAEG